MNRISLAAAMAAALALATVPGPAGAYDESAQAVEQASEAAEAARDHMLDEFGRDTLQNGRFLWEDGSHEVTRVVISLSEQMAYAYADDELVGVSTISSGTTRNPTPVGIFPILDKRRMHRSIKYDNAPMPFMQRLDDYGIALHAGHLPGRPASHGCIRLPSQFAAKLFAATRVGTTVLIGA